MSARRSGSAIGGARSPEGVPASGRSGPRPLWGRALSSEAVAETVFLVLVGAVLGYFLVASRRWETGAALLPTVVAVSGLLLLAVYTVLRWTGGARGRSRILDIGFAGSQVEPGLARRRARQFVATAAALLAGIWLLGFHIALPAYVGLYLWRYGRLHWWQAAGVALGFEALLVGLYDNVLHTSWHEPALLWLLGLDLA